MHALSLLLKPSPAGTFSLYMKHILATRTFVRIAAMQLTAFNFEFLRFNSGFCYNYNFIQSSRTFVVHYLCTANSSQLYKAASPSVLCPSEVVYQTLYLPKVFQCQNTLS